MDRLHVKGAPNYYQCYEGVLHDLFPLLKQHKFHHALIIHGDTSWIKVQNYFKNPSIKCQFIQYKGQCTHEEVDRIVEEVQGLDIDVIVGIGGGKVVDLAKACGAKANLPVSLVPTLASNCAPWTPLSVFYDQSGNFLEYIIFPDSTYMVLLDPQVVLDSPLPYLRAGIGDTIAKWYEADVLTRSLSQKPVSLDIALHAARLCRDILIDEGEKAIEAIETQHLNHSFNRVIETIIMAGGMVGGYGDHYGRVSGAHSIHNGLTHIEETHQHLHGNKVAYGIFVQLCLEDRLDEIKELLPFYRKMQLPAQLKELGIDHVTEEIVTTIAEGATKPNESIHFMNVSDPKQVKDAIYQLEDFMQY
ncbi:iron-containing alcohol dehydrogenase family protein [Gracilibacillus sp. YIM 98692]|uniref:iron-containing alcohol dehydrogenase family protein n=1 Tax=Gracilibacillus sp. YIM 98692 TaxID=2663532 RepID=UPI0013D50D58|nr:iron-containing alcohol dehydrogenase family protein [Gracilibacillus sp. YIM 98692]